MVRTQSYESQERASKVRDHNHDSVTRILRDDHVALRDAGKLVKSSAEASQHTRSEIITEQLELLRCTRGPGICDEQLI